MLRTNVTDNEDGILLAYSSDNTFNNNTLANNDGYGIWLRDYSDDNVIRGNIIINSTEGINILPSCKGNIVEDNYIEDLEIPNFFFNEIFIILSIILIIIVFIMLLSFIRKRKKVFQNNSSIEYQD
ncbi:MAG: NosD domain-containing protein [Candidatus Helarchaeota archaeon]